MKNETATPPAQLHPEGEMFEVSRDLVTTSLLSVDDAAELAAFDEQWAPLKWTEGALLDELRRGGCTGFRFVEGATLGSLPVGGVLFAWCASRTIGDLLVITRLAVHQRVGRSLSLRDHIKKLAARAKSHGKKLSAMIRASDEHLQFVLEDAGLRCAFGRRPNFFPAGEGRPAEAGLEFSNEFT